MLHEAARHYLGVPFRHQGRSAKALDCVGHGRMAAAMVGWTDVLAHDLPDYGKNPLNGMLDAQLEKAFGPPVVSCPNRRIPIDLSLLRPSDVVSMFYPSLIRHVGIIGDHPNGGLSLIHTSRSTGCVTEHGIDLVWAKRIAHVYRRAV